MRRSAARSAAGKMEELGSSRIRPPTSHVAIGAELCASAQISDGEPSTIQPAMPSKAAGRDIGIHREAVRARRELQVAQDHGALREEIFQGEMPACNPAGAPGVTVVA